jgi:probable phosphoglycerate mutase
MTEFLIIRHGQTPWNVDRRIQGWRDIELNDTGHQQARRLAHYLSQTTSPYQPVHAVYSSDLLRAQQTAQALAQALSAGTHRSYART